MPLDEVVSAAREAKAGGADRFCGCSQRELKDRDLPKVTAMIEAEGRRAGDLRDARHVEADRRALSDAGLDYYNHNLDTSPEYGRGCRRGYQDRLHWPTAVTGINLASVSSVW